MFGRFRYLYPRILLVMMLVTFLSPSMGWGTVASHEQLTHATVEIDWEELEHGHSHDNHHSSLPDESHDYQDAHSSIGHLLAHMPASLFETPILDFVQSAQTAPLFIYVPLIERYLEPPLPPPKIALPY
jgi:hypothetical protein